MFCHSVNGLPVLSHSFGDSSLGSPVLILSGVHGNEPEGVILAYRLLSEFQKTYVYSFPCVLIPEFNLEGLMSVNRLNGNSVDLNRNLPTKDWNKEAFNPKYPPGPAANSEPESKALVSWIDRNRPRFIFSLHSFQNFMLNANGDCLQVAEAMREICNYPIEESIGYPTPGCLGTYAGLERSIPTITYEIERGLSLDKICDLHLRTLMRAFDKIEELKR